MKKIITLAFILATAFSATAKKVKFAVDMTGITINSTGMHVAGDFQTVAGFSGGDFNSSSTSLTQEGITDIWSIVVDIPAFAKYEYKFLNGDQFYDAEFVPVESRVGYDFDDNRWIYVDSLANDTTAVGAVLFAGNAPAGLNLIRYLVDLQTQSSIASTGVHVSTDYQSYDPAKTRLYSFGSNIYEIINYVTSGTHLFQYVNGNTGVSAEIVPAGCATGTYRSVTVPHDTVLATVCFASCSACVAAGIAENETAKTPQLFPNPANEYTTLKFNSTSTHTVYMSDVTGRIVRSYNYVTDELRIEKQDLNAGIYFISIQNTDKISTSLKLIIQ
ncbi:MAG: hypothetical protein JWP12_1793 [Bacteroidetes bacterium]|nr:hypothetical protein [Bacteroidota bacterium]